MARKKFFRFFFPALFILSTGLFLIAVFNTNFFARWPDWVVDAALIVSELILAGFIIRKVNIKKRPYLLISAAVFFAVLWLFMNGHLEFLQSPAGNTKWYFLLGYFLFLPIFITFLLILRNGPKIIFNLLRLIFKGLIYIIRRSVRQPLWALKVFGILAVLAYIISLNIRLSNVEKRFGGTKLLQCSQDAIQKTMNKEVVRIEGTYGEGSGFPITENEIFTNFHVIDGETSPKVVFPDGSIETPTKIIGSKEKDMAILTINRKLKPLPFYGYLGNLATDPKPIFGEPVYAAGYAEGSDIIGGVTITRGSYNGTVYENTVHGSFIQTDATLVPGMSGGPLVDACGNVIGVNTMGLAGLSMFLDMTSVQNSSGDFSDKDVAKIKIDTTTPLGVVDAYYTYIGARDLKDAYNLIDPMRQTEPFDHWTQGYATTLQTSLVSISVDAKNKNKINIKLVSQDWINGNMVYKYFEGYWIVGKNLKLTGVSIQHVQNPGYDWFYPPIP